MKLIEKITLNHPIGGFRLSHNGTRFMSIREQGIISYTIDGKSEGPVINPPVLFDVDYFDEEQIITVEYSMERVSHLVLYDVETSKITARMKTDNYPGDIRSVCVDQTQGRIFAGIITGEFTNYIYSYDLALRKQNEFETQTMPFFSNLRMSHAGDKLASGSVLVEVWDVSGTPKLLTEECPLNSDCTGTPCEVNSVDITPDGRYAAAGFHGARGSCVVFDTDLGKPIGWYGPIGSEIEFYHTRALSLSPDGQYIAVGLAEETTLKIYRISDGVIIDQQDMRDYIDVSFLPTENTLLVSRGNNLEFWSLDL